jgi:rhodanese-related sulfurtransferase
MGYGVPDSGVDFVEISVRDAYLLMKNSKAVFVDSRDLDDYKFSRLQTSLHVSANDLFFHKEKVNEELLRSLVDLSKAGKTIVCMSDSCIRGDRNRGHVSRCRHVAQYLVELGADRTRVVRLGGGLNRWKAQGLDGILGDPRAMYAGAPVDWDGLQRKLQEGAVVNEDSTEDEALQDYSRAGVVNELMDILRESQSTQAVEAETVQALEPALELKIGVRVLLHSLKGAPELNGKIGTCDEFNEGSGRWKVTLANGEQKNVKPDNLEAQRPVAATTLAVSEQRSAEPLPKTSVVLGGAVLDAVANIDRCDVNVCRPLPPRENTPTCYRVLKGEVYRKPSTDSDKIMKLDRPLFSIVRTTGEVWQGPNGGNWAELDTLAGEKKGWVYLDGPGFGATTRKITSEYLQA